MQPVLAKYEIPEFHTSECVAGQKGTHFEGWDEERKRKLCARVRQITKKYSIRAFSFAIKKADYDTFVSAELRETGGRFHYTWAVRMVLAFLDKWADDVKMATPFEYIFDWMGEKKKNKNPSRSEIETVMAQAESLRPGRYEGHYSFRKRHDVPALQCTDMLAWTCYQFALNAYIQTPLKPIAEESFWEFERHRKNEWLTAGAQLPENLKKWADAELADPRSQKRRREWLERTRLEW